MLIQLFLIFLFRAAVNYYYLLLNFQYSHEINIEVFSMTKEILAHLLLIQIRLLGANDYYNTSKSKLSMITKQHLELMEILRVNLVSCDWLHISVSIRL